MKTALSVAVALALVAGVAEAQSSDNTNNRDHRGQAAPARPQARPPAQPQAGARTGARSGFTGGQHTQVMPQGRPSGVAPSYAPAYRGQNTGAPAYRGQNTYGGQRGAYQPGGYQSGLRGGNQTGQRGSANVQRSFRAQDQGRPQFSPGRYQRSYQAARRFNVGAYYQPRGWYYRRWGYGDYLPFGWFAASYYLNGFDYGLPAPPIGAEWVRNGPDAVLVDIWTGEVLSVEYGVFY
ncbi:MAG TPA: RcnB family protein [Caulobacteraceae bacterium]